MRMISSCFHKIRLYVVFFTWNLGWQERNSSQYVDKILQHFTLCCLNLYEFKVKVNKIVSELVDCYSELERDFSSKLWID